MNIEEPSAAKLQSKKPKAAADDADISNEEYESR